MEKVESIQEEDGKKKVVSIIELPFSMPGLNGGNGLMRAHWSKRKEWKDKLMWLVLEKLGDGSAHRHKGLVRIDYHRNYVSTPMDRMDNLPSSFKFLCDAMVACGVIIDDSEKIVPETPRYTQSKGKPMTRVVVTDL